MIKIKLELTEDEYFAMTLALKLISGDRVYLKKSEKLVVISILEKLKEQFNGG